MRNPSLHTARLLVIAFSLFALGACGGGGGGGTGGGGDRGTSGVSAVIPSGASETETSTGVAPAVEPPPDPDPAVEPADRAEAGIAEPGLASAVQGAAEPAAHPASAATDEATAVDPIERALADGDAAAVTERELVDALLASRATLDTERTRVLDALFGRTDPARAVGPLDWDLTHDSAVLRPLALGDTVPILLSNTSFKEAGTIEETLALAGVGTKARRLLFGGNPFHALARAEHHPGGSANAAMQTFLENGVRWLADRDGSDTSDFDIVIAHQQDSYWGRHDASTHAWFAETWPNARLNAPDTCESAALAGCLAGAELLVIGNDTGSNDDHGVPFDAMAILAAVRAARADGVAVLLARNGYRRTELDEVLFDELGIVSDWNYWRQEGLAGFVPDEMTLAAEAPLARLSGAVEALDGGTLDFDYASADVCTSYVGRTTCHESRVLDGTGVALAKRIGDAREGLRERLRALDRRGTDLFSLGEAYRPDKLAVLLADKYRERVRFPLDKLSSDQRAFQRARFADAAVHYARPNNPVQPDMGLFADAQRALHEAATVSRALVRTPRRFSEWRSSGLYVPPGRAVFVTRTDSTKAAVRVRFNMLRHTTRLWDTNGYNRPSGLSSHVVDVAPGASVTLSSPHGGPLYVWTEAFEPAGDEAPQPIALTISGVLDNPLLDAFDEASVVAFSEALMSSDSDWVDIRTPLVEIHSLKSHLIRAFARQDGDESDGYTTADVLAYVDDLSDYLIKGNYEYAGFASASLAPLDARVADWCAARALTVVDYGGRTLDLCRDRRIHALPRVQHINADIAALCGGLCAGNPFDSGGPIMPLGWGENHEMGHNLQRARLKIYDGRSTEVSNNLFPLRTTREWSIAAGLARHPSQSRPSHQRAFELLQAAIAAGRPADASHPLWSGTGIYDLAFERLAFFVQLVYAAGDWDVWTKVYIAERIFEDASRDEAKWLAVRDRIGFGAYAASEARAISGNDFLYVMVSVIDGSDYADWFAAWGVETSDEARAQVASNGILSDEPVVFRYVGGTLPVARPSGVIPLDGRSRWADPEG